MTSGLDASTETLRPAFEAVCSGVDAPGDADHVGGVAPRLVARARSTAEVSGVLRAAAMLDLAVVPRGRGTKLAWGAPPRRVDVVLDLAGMDRVLDHAAGDLVVVTEAGVGLAALQEAVAGAGQRLALDQTVHDATVGGTVATGTSGPRRASVGTVRDLLVGVTMVRADGTVARAGGRVVKNVAGYDLCKLVTGSFGTLAVVTEAVLRLHPLPADGRYVTLACDDAATLARLAQVVRRDQLAADAVEVDWTVAGRGTLTVLVEGTSRGVAARAAAVADLLPAGAATTLLPPDWWGVHPWHLAGMGPGQPTALKVTCRLGGVGDVLVAAREVGVHVRGSAAAGVLHAAVPPTSVVADTVAAVDTLRAVAAQHGGSVVVLDAPPEVRAAVDLWGPVPGLELMRRVKARLDPDGRLSPGRFVGGI